MESFFFLKEKDEKYKSLVNEVEFFDKEETYGFNSSKKPPPIKEMEQFEKEFYDIAKNIVFHPLEEKYGKFQSELKKDLTELKQLKSVIIAADKSNNFYTYDTETYKILPNNNIEKD